jgi:hypothetical protein
MSELVWTDGPEGDHEHDWIFSRVLCSCDTMHTECSLCDATLEPCWIDE